MNTTIETIDAEKAKKYLALVEEGHQRKFNKNRAEKYAKAMRGHQWILTHQGIAFDENGRLIDGQHRLAAIPMSGTTQKFLVTRGLPVAVKNGATLFTIDSIDRGDMRSVADQLAMRNKIKNSHRVATACRLILASATGDATIQCSTHTALFIIEKYPHLKTLQQGTIEGLRSGYIWAAVSIAAKVEDQTALKFYQKLITGEMIRKGDPAFCARNYLLDSTKRSPSGFVTMMNIRNLILNAIKTEHLNGKMEKINLSSEGFDYFAKRQVRTFKMIQDFVGKQ